MNNSELTSFYIIRHGETHGNVANVLSGGNHDTELTDNGKSQAELKAQELRDTEFDFIIDTGLKRSQQTAEIINQERNIERLTAEALREKIYGKFEGKSRDEAKNELREAFREYETLTSDDEIMKFHLYPDGESDDEAITRFITKLRELAIAYPGKKMLVVAHGGVMRYFLIKLGLISYKDLGTHAIKNTAQILVESDGVDFFVRETTGIEGLTITKPSL